MLIAFQDLVIMPDAEDTPVEGGSGGDEGGNQGPLNDGDENTAGEATGEGNAGDGGNKGPLNVGDEL